MIKDYSKVCPRCVAHFYTDNEDDILCRTCVAIDIDEFWSAENNPRVTVKSDGNQFVSQINAGITGETYLSVGYSCPNYAWITRDMIPEISKALDEKWKDIVELPLEEMMPQLLELCEVANQVYNKLI